MSDWILVVDDDTSNLRMASHILSTEKMRVSSLKSGEDAIKFLQKNRPDLIFLTADEDSNTETKALEAGALDFIRNRLCRKCFCCG